jgi:hypothetical protein
LSNDFFWPLNVGVALFGVGYGLAIVATKALPLWLGVVAVVLGIIGITPLGFLAFIAFMVWSLIATVLTYRRGAEAAGEQHVTRVKRGDPQASYRAPRAAFLMSATSNMLDLE